MVPVLHQRLQVQVDVDDLGLGGPLCKRRQLLCHTPWLKKKWGGWVWGVFVGGWVGEALQRTAVVSHILGLKKRGEDVVCVCVGGGGCSSKKRQLVCHTLRVKKKKNGVGGGGGVKLVNFRPYVYYTFTADIDCQEVYGTNAVNTHYCVRGPHPRVARMTPGAKRMCCQAKFQI